MKKITLLITLFITIILGACGIGEEVMILSTVTVTEFSQKEGENINVGEFLSRNDSVNAKIEELLKGAEQPAQSEITITRNEDFLIDIFYETGYTGESPPKSAIYQVWFDSEGAKIQGEKGEVEHELLDTEEAALLRELISKVKKDNRNNN